MGSFPEGSIEQPFQAGSIKIIIRHWDAMTFHFLQIIYIIKLVKGKMIRVIGSIDFPRLLI